MFFSCCIHNNIAPLEIDHVSDGLQLSIPNHEKISIFAVMDSVHLFNNILFRAKQDHDYTYTRQSWTWVECLTRNLSIVSSSPIEGSLHFLEQEMLPYLSIFQKCQTPAGDPSLLRTFWFQEQIWYTWAILACFTNKVKQIRTNMMINRNQFSSKIV